MAQTQKGKVDISGSTAGLRQALVSGQRDLKTFSSAVRKSSFSMNDFAKSMGKSIGSFVGVGAAIGAVTKAISYNIQTAKDFEYSMSKLSSLTGLAGDNLDWLKQKAIEVGSQTTLTASQVAEAYMLIGSKAPQLLQAKEALAAVTKDAITLAEAGGIELPDAANTLTLSLNQMGATALHSTEYINILAAASQQGSGDIAWLGSAITQSGAAAKSVGMDYTELVSALEVLAKGGWDASTSGTALKGVLMSLEKNASQDCKPSVVGLSQALENLNNKHYDLSAWQKLVGKNFAAQAMYIVENRKEYNRLTDAISGTNTAEEQATINKQNLRGAVLSLQSAWEGFNLTLNSSNGILTAIVNKITEIVNTFNAISQGGLGGMRDVAHQQSLDAYVNDTFSSIKGEVIDRQRAGSKKSEAELLAETFKAYIPHIRQNYSKEDGDYIIKQLANQVIAAIKEAKGQVKNAPATTTGEQVTTADEKALKKILAEQARLAKVGNEKLPLSEITGANVPTDLSNVQNTQNAKAYADQQQRIAELSQLASMGMESLAESLYNFSFNKGTIDQNGISDGGLSKFQGVPIETLDTTSMNKGLRQTDQLWQSVTGSIQSAASAMTNLGDAGFNTAGVIAQAIAQIALSFGNALAQDKTTKGNIWAFIGAAISSAATLVSVISTVKSNAAYAEGGIVESNYGAGGLSPVMSEGEMVLNAGQQAAMFNMLKNGGNAGGGSSTPYVSGEKIYLGLNNWGKRTGRGELVFAK